MIARDHTAEEIRAAIDELSDLERYAMRRAEGIE